jgi:hypothetical protein
VKDPQFDSLLVDVYDKDTLSDDQMGFGKVALNNLQKGVTTGMLNIYVEY